MMDDFHDPQGNTFVDKLEPSNRFIKNKEGDWQQNEMNRRIRFEHLPAGDYHLHVRGTTALGISSNIFTINLHVKEFFYKTWWFISSIVLAAMGLLYMFHRLRVSQLLRLERLRSKLSIDLHDGVGSLPNGIIRIFRG